VLLELPLQLLLRGLARLFLGDEACGQQLVAQRTIHDCRGDDAERELPILRKRRVDRIALKQQSAKLEGVLRSAYRAARYQIVRPIKKARSVQPGL
jgi:hypothetical protein